MKKSTYFLISSILLGISAEVFAFLNNVFPMIILDLLFLVSLIKYVDMNKYEIY